MTNPVKKIQKQAIMEYELFYYIYLLYVIIICLYIYGV